VIEIPGYTILGKIGQGGMASVYRARQVLLDRDVALKVMSSQLAQDEAYAQRFLQEARMLAALNHPNVVQVYDVGVTPTGLHYFSMALLPGGDFAERMRSGLSETELLKVLVATATALGFAHARGYVHRDVTPGNILFDAHDTPILTDFGIARALSAVSRLTSSGMSIGTSHYMSPEQARGGPEIDHRSDIYGLGVLCYEAVAGETPFKGEDGFAVAFAHVNDPVPRLPEEVARWQPLIDKAMAKAPADRFQTCAEFIEGLKVVAPGEFSTLRPTMAPPPPRKTPLPKAQAKMIKPRESSASKLPLLIVGGVLILGLILAGVAWWTFGRSEAPTPPPVTPAPLPTPPPSKPPVVEAPPTVPDPVVDEGSDEGELPGVDGESDIATDAEAALKIALETTVVDPVVTLIGMGRANLAANRLTTPPRTNALARFKQALLIDPKSVEAGQGISSVAEALLKQAEAKPAAAPLAEWIALIAEAEAVAAEHPAAAPQLALAAQARQSRAATLMTAGAEAIRAFDREAAVAAYEAALLAAPGLKDAQSGLTQARKVGTVGYVFRDREAEGQAGPEFVVTAARVALGRREVTRAEFSRYWGAAGSARFGAVDAKCRDRNSGGLFGGSKTRTWQTPGFAQAENHPVVCITFAMASGYAEWLSKQTNQRYRLPSVAELAPPGSLVADCKSNLRDGKDCADGFETTAPVGSFAARAPGLFDAIGNVSEWTTDCDGGNCKERLVAGGNWYDNAGEPGRLARPADTGFNTVGFRLAREID